MRTFGTFGADRRRGDPVVAWYDGSVSRSVATGGSSATFLSFTSASLFSCSFWIKTTATAGGFIVGKRNEGNAWQGWQVYNDATGHIGLYRAGDVLNSNNMKQTTAAFNDGNWHHVVITVAGATAADVTIWVDGVNVATTTPATNVLGTMNHTSPAKLGEYSNPSPLDVQRYRGQLDELGIYSVVLNGSQVAEIYNGGTPRDLLQLSTAASLLSYTPMIGNQNVAEQFVAGALPFVHTSVVVAPRNPIAWPPATDCVYWFDANALQSLSGSQVTWCGSQHGLTQMRASLGTPQVFPFRNGKLAWSKNNASTRQWFQHDQNLTLNQPYTYVSVGTLIEFANFQFTCHSTSGSLPFYREPSNNLLSQFAGTIRGHLSMAGAGGLPYIAISVMNGASSTLRVRRLGLSDYFGTVAGTVGTNAFSNAVINLGGSNQNDAHHWRGLIATHGKYAGAKDATWQNEMMSRLSGLDYYDILAA